MKQQLVSSYDATMRRRVGNSVKRMTLPYQNHMGFSNGYRSDLAIHHKRLVCRNGMHVPPHRFREELPIMAGPLRDRQTGRRRTVPENKT
jgi:hypothetical protein